MGKRTKKWKKLPFEKLENALNMLEASGGVEEFLSGKLKVVVSGQKWHECCCGVIDLGTVVSNGKTGPEWIEWLFRQGYCLAEWAMEVLLSESFHPTCDKVTHVVLIRGSLFEERDRKTSNIRAEATHRKMGEIDAEVACLLREKFSDEDLASMGLEWFVIMHEPIEVSNRESGLLCIGRYPVGRELGAACDGGGCGWNDGGGFVFSAQQAAFGN